MEYKDVASMLDMGSITVVQSFQFLLILIMKKYFACLQLKTFLLNDTVLNSMI